MQVQETLTYVLDFLRRHEFSGTEATLRKELTLKGLGDGGLYLDIQGLDLESPHGALGLPILAREGDGQSSCTVQTPGTSAATTPNGIPEGLPPVKVRSFKDLHEAVEAPAAEPVPTGSEKRSGPSVVSMAVVPLEISPPVSASKTEGSDVEEGAVTGPQVLSAGDGKSGPKGREYAQEGFVRRDGFQLAARPEEPVSLEHAREMLKGLAISVQPQEDDWDSDDYEDEDDPGYHRQPIEDEEAFLANEIEVPSDEDDCHASTRGVGDSNRKGVGDDPSYSQEEAYFSGEEYYRMDAEEGHNYGGESPTGSSVAAHEQHDSHGSDEARSSKERHSDEPGFSGRTSSDRQRESDRAGLSRQPSRNGQVDNPLPTGGTGGGSSGIAQLPAEGAPGMAGHGQDSAVEGLNAREFGDQEVEAFLEVFDEQWVGHSGDDMDAEPWVGGPPGDDKGANSQQGEAGAGNEEGTFGFSFPEPSSNDQLVALEVGSKVWSVGDTSPDRLREVSEGRNSGVEDLDDMLASWRRGSTPTSPGASPKPVEGLSPSSADAQAPRSSGSGEVEDVGDDIPSEREEDDDEEGEEEEGEEEQEGEEEEEREDQEGVDEAENEEDEEQDDVQVLEKDGAPATGGGRSAGDADDEDLAIHEQMLRLKAEAEEYETFNLRVIHRKNRTGFEEEKDFPVRVNTVIAGRYFVTEYLGSGAFSKAIQAHDLHTGMDVCMKIIKNNKDFFDQSLDEIKLLVYINKQDPADEHHILRLYDYFYHREHLFIVCELLRANLYEFHKYNRESGGEVYFTMARIQLITKQCLDALAFIHSLGLMHCDLKPENILVKSYSRCEVKVIDMGSSCFHTDHLCPYVQSRSYRAPEVILGRPYEQKIDIWSLGCILAELSSGNVLFQNDSLATLLARVIGILGPIDPAVLAKGRDTHKYFTKSYMLYERNPESDRLEYLIPKKTSLRHRLPNADPGFISFLSTLLEVNPDKRPTAEEALNHAWLQQPYERDW